jgi:predicted nucleic acid-binding protein
MNHVFLDTVSMIAVWNSSDQWHKAADAADRSLLTQGRRLVTTDLVLIECGNAAARHPFRRRVNVLRQSFRDEGLIVVPTDQEMEAGWAAYDRGAAGQAGIVDPVSFIVMRRLGRTEAFTNDRHFQAAGFMTLFVCVR